MCIIHGFIQPKKYRKHTHTSTSTYQWCVSGRVTQILRVIIKIKYWIDRWLRERSSWRRHIKTQLHEKLSEKFTFTPKPYILTKLRILSIVWVPNNNNTGDLFTDIRMFFSFALIARSSVVCAHCHSVTGFSKLISHSLPSFSQWVSSVL